MDDTLGAEASRLTFIAPAASQGFYRKRRCWQGYVRLLVVDGPEFMTRYRRVLFGAGAAAPQDLSESFRALIIMRSSVYNDRAVYGVREAAAVYEVACAACSGCSDRRGGAAFRADC
jgi:hypothetical protein